MTSRYEFVTVRHPDLQGTGRMTRARLARKAHEGWVEVTEEELAAEQKAAEAGRRKKRDRKTSPPAAAGGKEPEPTQDFDQPAEDETPTAEPAGKSKKE